MSNKEVNYTISGDASSFVSAMERAARATADASSGIKSRFDGVGKAFEAVQGRLLMITAIVSGGAFFKAAIAESNKLAGEVGGLAKRFDLTTAEASALNTALGDIYSDSETYIGAFDKFAKQIKTNESGLQEMGLQTRDSNGHLRNSNDLFREALATVGQYKPGLDQTTAAMQLFGKGVDDVMKLQKLNNDVLDDARQKNEDLGLTITNENLAASKAYKAAMNDVGDVLTAVTNAVGQAVMPVFTELANYFASTGPTVVAVFKGALTGLLLVFRAIEAAVKLVARVCFELFSTLIDQLRNMSGFFSAILTGDIRGAVAAAGAWIDRFKSTGRNLGESFVEGYQSAVDGFGGDLDRIWGKGTDAKVNKGGGKQQGEFKDDKKAKADPSFMKYYELALEQEKTLATQRDAIHGMSKQQELEFWNSLLQTAKLTSADQVSVQKKAAELRIEILKDEARTSEDLARAGVASKEARLLASVAIDEEEARTRQALGQLTQQQLLAMEEQFEVRKQQIRMAALDAQKAMLDPERDPVQVEQTNAKIQELELAHQQRLQQIRNQAVIATAEAQGKTWQDLAGRVSSLWDQGVNAMMNGTLTWQGATRAVGMQLAGWFSSAVVKPMVTQWLFGETAKTGATTAGTAIRGAVEIAAAAKSVLLWAATAAKNIMSNAWAAMAAAWQAMAGIPYVGPVLAVAAAAATFAGVAALAGKVMSAEGGYDIPAGVNPMTQLHEKEMVLPAKHADVIRGLADAGGAASGGVQTPVQIVGTPMRGGFFMMHRDDLAAAINQLRRDRVIKP
jgi:hypothetical protein